MFVLCRRVYNLVLWSVMQALVIFTCFLLLNYNKELAVGWGYERRKIDN